MARSKDHIHEEVSEVEDVLSNVNDMLAAHKHPGPRGPIGDHGQPVMGPRGVKGTPGMCMYVCSCVCIYACMYAGLETMVSL
jgi:hypothetical protein